MAEAVGLVLNVAQTLCTALQTKEVRELCFMFHCETQLRKLEGTMETVKAVLLDVDSKRQGLTHAGQVWVEKLKDAVYDVDDLLDEFNIIRQQRHQMGHAKFSEKVGHFFSRNNKYFVAFNLSREIKLLRESLEAIAKDHADFGFTSDVTQPVKRREETCSVISELEVIGRDTEKEEIVGMLLSEAGHSNVSFVSIVGMGGLGKTTLAQLVYNDERVKERFQERIWVCVSEDFGIREILGKMLEKKDSTLQEMQREVEALLASKRYLLVLDDVWNDSHEEWRNLKPFLVSDASGSKIIVTSRSKEVATSIGNDSTMYELKGLSEENSWTLFKMIAFGQREDQPVDPDLVDIGNDIVKKCANVPLPIKVIASLLHGQEKSQWQSFRSSNDLAKMSHAGRQENSIMPTLMFSYYHLTPELKSCFSFCSLFSKDRIIEKEELISLWLAEGFLIKNNNVSQSMEDVGEQYLNILLNRCFFQDIQLDEYGDVYSFKMHDLMHDLATEVAGKESLIVTPNTEHPPGHKIRHLSEDRGSSNLFLSDSLRTYMWLSDYYLRTLSSVEGTAIISKCRHLRILSLHRSTLPSSLGKLLHLRYLDISKNDGMKMLPKSITKLHNLQILKLSECIHLKGLPEDMSKLVNLRTLDIHNCADLTYMPRGMSNLTNLHTLTDFVVGGVDSKQTQGSKLEDLKDLRNLKGDLRIRVRNFCSHNRPQAAKRAFILKDARLRNLEIRCGVWCEIVQPSYFSHCASKEDIEFDQSEVHETLVEDLCPNDDIRRIGLLGYKGTKLPSWASMTGSSVNELQHVTSLSQFCNLKVVELVRLVNIEYIEIDAAWARAKESGTFFPVLERLVLRWMPKLKGWWRELRWMEMEGGGGRLVDANGLSIEGWESMPYFPRLHDLTIEGCRSMTYFPPCPHVKKLHLMGVNEALTFCMTGGVVASGASSSSFTLRSRSWPPNVPVSLCLDKLTTDNASVLNSLLRDEFVGGAIDIDFCDKEMKNIKIVKEGFERWASSLRHLSIRSTLGVEFSDVHPGVHAVEEEEEEEEEEGVPWKYLQSLSSLELCCFRKMVKLPKGLRYLTSLQSLKIKFCHNLEEPGDCIRFLTSLQSLEFLFCPELKALPECISSLTSLQYLHINISKLKSLPETMHHLTSLTTLQIMASDSELRERCREPDGEDWPKICHIPKVSITAPVPFRTREIGFWEDDNADDNEDDSQDG